MITEKEEKILNKLHAIGLCIKRGRKQHKNGNHVMADKYLANADAEISDLMAYIEPEGRT